MIAVLAFLASIFLRVLLGIGQLSETLSQKYLKTSPRVEVTVRECVMSGLVRLWAGNRKRGWIDSSLDWYNCYRRPLVPG